MTLMPWDRKKLSEKTLELNFASQLNHACGGKLLWFGLTQQQEAEQGFDIATRIGRGLFIVQMKASTRVLRTGERQFKAQHHRLEALRHLTSGGHTALVNSVFYAFPVIGTPGELSNHRDVLANTWLCDVGKIPPVGLPTKRNGGLRSDENHYVNILPGRAPLKRGTTGTATFHSDPVEAPLVSGPDFARQILEGAPDEPAFRGLLAGLTHNNFDQFWEFSQNLGRKAFAIARIDTK